jgi:hypothetical protein
MDPWQALSLEEAFLALVVGLIAFGCCMGVCCGWSISLFLYEDLAEGQYTFHSKLRRYLILTWLVLMHMYLILIVVDLGVEAILGFIVNVFSTNLAQVEPLHVAWILVFFFVYLPFVALSGIEMTFVLGNPRTTGFTWQQWLLYAVVAALYVIAVLVGVVNDDNAADRAVFALCYVACALALLGTFLGVKKVEQRAYYWFLGLRILVLIVVATGFQAFYIIFSLSELFHLFVQFIHPVAQHRPSKSYSNSRHRQRTSPPPRQQRKRQEIVGVTSEAESSLVEMQPLVMTSDSYR